MGVSLTNHPFWGIPIDGNHQPVRHAHPHWLPVAAASYSSDGSMAAATAASLAAPKGAAVPRAAPNLRNVAGVGWPATRLRSWEYPEGRLGWNFDSQVGTHREVIRM